MKTCCAPLNATNFFHAPTHDEVAMRAYLNWEKAGQPADSSDRFWAEAEAEMCAERLAAAEAAAERANRPWPPVRIARIIPTAPKRLKKLVTSVAKKTITAKAKLAKAVK